jgi:putative tricarboxylic transport membrane protein
VRPQIVDRWVGAACVAVAVVWSALVLATIPADGMEGAPGPRAFPLLLGELLGVLGLVMLAGTMIRPLAHGLKAAPYEPIRRDEVVIVGGGLAVVLGYAFLMDKIGFLLATPIVVVVALRCVLGIRRWLAIAAVAAGLTVGCYVVFGMAMEANLPHGTWITLHED